MADILLQMRIRADRERVFAAVSRPQGLDAWWTLTCSGEAVEGAEYLLGFGPGYDWRARVTRCLAPERFELVLVEAAPDWRGTRVGFQLEEAGEATTVHFEHRGWPEVSDHFRASSYCWALYLRLLQRYVERQEVVPYGERLEA